MTPKSRTGAAVHVWDTSVPLPEDFAGRWSLRVARAPHANFSLDLACVQWDAARGRHSRVALVDDPRGPAALVLRAVDGEWHCGWPWRWQAVIEDPERRGPVGMTEEEARVLFRYACALAGWRRLRFFVPHPAPQGVPSYVANGTLIQSLEHTDEELLAAMNESKRRAIRRARDSAVTVVEADSLALFRAYGEIGLETKLRHGAAPPPLLARPGPGEDWREWELPWMSLLVALRGSRVVSGFGMGLFPGGMLEGRTSATNAEGRKIGAFPLVLHEAARRMRDRGYRWHNNGGDTFFKRDMVGALATPVMIHCWLGGRGWWLPNAGESARRRVAPRLGRLRRRLLDRFAPDGKANPDAGGA